MADTTSPRGAFGRLLKIGRVTVGLTQDELAARVGIGQSTLSSYENGDSEPSLSMAVVLAEALQLDIADLAEPFRAAPRSNSRRRRQLTQVPA